MQLYFEQYITALQCVKVMPNISYLPAECELASTSKIKANTHAQSQTYFTGGRNP